MKKYLVLCKNEKVEDGEYDNIESALAAVQAYELSNPELHWSIGIDTPLTPNSPPEVE